MAEFGIALEAGTERPRTSRPVCCSKKGETMTPDKLRFEQEAPATEALKDEKRKPVTDKVLKEALNGRVNSSVKVTFELEAYFCVECWLSISGTLRARSYTARNFMRPSK